AMTQRLQLDLQADELAQRVVALVAVVGQHQPRHVVVRRGGDGGEQTFFVRGHRPLPAGDGTPARNAASASLTARGCSIVTEWPPGTIPSREPAIFSCRCRDNSGGVARSSAPTRTSVGSLIFSNSPSTPARPSTPPVARVEPIRSRADSRVRHSS